MYITRHTVGLNTLTVCLQASSVDLLVEFSAGSSLIGPAVGCGATGTWVNLGGTAGGARVHPRQACNPPRAPPAVPPFACKLASSPRTYKVVPAAAAPSHPCRGAPHAHGVHALKRLERLTVW